MSDDVTSADIVEAVVLCGTPDVHGDWSAPSLDVYAHLRMFSEPGPIRLALAYSVADGTTSATHDGPVENWTTTAKRHIVERYADSLARVCIRDFAQRVRAP